MAKNAAPVAAALGFTLPPLNLASSSSAKSSADATLDASGFTVSYGNRHAPWIIGGAIVAGVALLAYLKRGR